MQQFQEKVLDAASTADTANSAAIDASNMLQISAQCIATGSPTGAVKIQVSNDSPIGLKGFSSSVWTPINWTDIPYDSRAPIGTPPSVEIPEAGSFLIAKLDICYQFIRIVYTGSGTGTITVRIKAISV